VQRNTEKVYVGNKDFFGLQRIIQSDGYDIDSSGPFSEMKDEAKNELLALAIL
jgi:hypothetical protein